jgi:hypothetical protein
MASIGTTGEAQMITYQELWAKASKHYGGFIPPTTFRRWIEDFCLLDIQSDYQPSEAECVVELAKIARRFPKGSPKVKQTFRKRMEATANGTERSAERAASAVGTRIQTHC